LNLLFTFEHAISKRSPFVAGTPIDLSEQVKVHLSKIFLLNGRVSVTGATLFQYRGCFMSSLLSVLTNNPYRAAAGYEIPSTLYFRDSLYYISSELYTEIGLSPLLIRVYL